MGRIHARDFLIGVHLSLAKECPGLTREAFFAAIQENEHRIGPRGVALGGPVREFLTRHRHQQLIDRSVVWGVRVFGSEVCYVEIYPEYVRQAQARGMAPVPLKTFKNRAGGQETWATVIERVEASV